MDEHEFIEAVGRDAIVRRLDRLATRIVGLIGELEANRREYEEVQRAYRVALAEHEHLTTKLRALDHADNLAR